MSYLSQKSTANLEAATLLIANGFYASSLHCSYYAVLQHITCLISIKCNISFEELAKKSNGGSSHEKLISDLQSFLITNIKKTEVLQIEVEKTNIYKLNRKIKDLKGRRIEADYLNLEIEADKSMKA